MYFLLIRPQKKKEKQINAMRSSIKVGDDVITIGGIYGTVSRVKDDSLIIQVGADKTKLEVTRWAISKVVEDGPSPAKTTRPRQEAAEKEEEPVRKGPRKRLEKSEPNPVSSDPIEANPLEVDGDNSPLEEE